MGKKSAPEAPDPYATADAQAQSNRETAITQHQLNMVNQTGPWGNVTYNQTGNNTYTDANGNTVSTPQYTATTTLSPSQQRIFNQSQAAQGNLAQIANEQTRFLGDYLGNGIDTSGLPELQSSFGKDFATSYAGADDFSADRQRYEDALWQRGASTRAQDDASIRNTLAQKGIQEGSAAWNAEMERMGRQNTDARLATMLASGQEQSRMVGLARDAAQFGNSALAQMAGLNNSARQQGMAELFALRNQPINEITALMSGSQVSNPAQMGAATPQTSVAGTDIAGLIGQDYQNQMNAWQSQMGGTFGLGGALLGAAGSAGGFGALLSDERLKVDIQRVGTLDSGLGVYTYKYAWGGPVHMGVMAQEVQRVNPDAVVETDSGFLAVDYGKVH